MANLTEDDLLRTVECYLKHECQVRPAAAELGIGRHTFRNRLGHARKQGLLPEQKSETFDVADKCRLEAQVTNLGSGYDTLLLGHFHRLMQLRSVIVNGSIKGFDEYAKRENFPWDPPQQALWITHPERGITLQMPVHLDRNKSGWQSSDWVSWQDRGKANG